MKNYYFKYKKISSVFFDFGMESKVFFAAQQQQYMTND